MTCSGVFWDMDSFMTRPVALAAPAAGVALGRFRTRTIDAAERLASMFGFMGDAGRAAVMYPWTSASLRLLCQFSGLTSPLHVLSA